MPTTIVSKGETAKFTMPEGDRRETFRPRDYQLELLEFARKSNCIVSLGTGFGKTYIAILLIKEYASELSSNGLEAGQKPKRAFFVTNNVTLAQQQEEHIRTHLNMDVVLIHGLVSQKYYNNISELRSAWDNNEVFVVTAQILVDMINFALIKMEEIAVLILDECHHIIGSEHPYRQLMRHSGERPRILGLTASVITGNVPLQKIENMIRAVERLTCCTLRTNDITKASRYGTRPEELIFCYDNEVVLSESVFGILTNAMEAKYKCWEATDLVELKKLVREAFHRTRDVLVQLGPVCCGKICFMYLKQLKAQLDQQVWNQNRIRLVGYARTILEQCSILLHKQKRLPRQEGEMDKFVTNRVRRLFEILQSFQKISIAKYNEQISALIFVKERHTALLLSQLLKALAKAYPQKYGFIKSDYVVGRQGIAIHNVDDLMAANKRQEGMVHKFKQGAINVLVCTSVLEEGIDVKSCNCVIRFSPPTDFRSYVQSRGRARAKRAIYCVLAATSEARDIDEKLAHYNQVEQLLRSYVSSEASDLDDELVDDNAYEPYVVDGTGAKVTMSSAISLINRYCSKLPSDVFTRLVPQVNVIPVNVGHQTMYKAELLLPINAPVTAPIRLEQPMPRAALAKMAVALEACKILHRKKELTDNLLPAGKDVILESKLPEDLLGEVCEEYDHMRIAGHNIKNRRLHDRKVSRIMNNVLVRPETEAYVYMIDIRLVAPISEKDNVKKRKIVNPHEEDFAFGFVCTVKLPPITPFPVFMRQGKTMVSFVRTPRKMSFDQSLLEKICRFHQHIFDDILRVVKNAVFFNPTSSVMPLLVVPIVKERDLHGNLVDCRLNTPLLDQDIRCSLSRPTLDQRKTWTFKKEDFEDAVVTPWYRINENPTYFYVAKIEEGGRPSARFPDDKYTDFNQYYKLKYDIDILHQDQPLLEVDRSSERMNLIFPRHVSARVRKQAYDPTQQQVLVPELVHIHPLSANYWAMVIALPTIFYRLNQFLLVEELRTTILADALKSRARNSDTSWDEHPLDYDHLSVQTITQLRKRNTDTSADNSRMEEQSADEQPSDASFVIGVWDPQDADDFRQHKMDGLVSNESECLDRITEQMATGKHDLEFDGSDAEVEEYDIFTEFKEEVQCTKNLFEPRPDVVESLGGQGWAPAGTVHGNDFLSIISEPLDGMTFNLENLNNDLSLVLSNKEKPQNDKAKSTLPSNGQRHMRDRNVENSEKVTEPESVDEVIDKHYYEVSLDEEIYDSTIFSSLQPSETSSVDNQTLDRVVNGQFECCSPSVEMTFVFEKWNESDVAQGVPPALMLQALTTASASDGVNLERLETIGDSFLKMAVTVYLFATFPDMHEGRLSFYRSKEVSNKSLCMKGYQKDIPSVMETSKFDPNPGDTGWDADYTDQTYKVEDGVQTINLNKVNPNVDDSIPYNPMTQQCINDKSVADAVEALIGAHLISLGHKSALQFMDWLGLKVLVNPEKPISPLLMFDDSEQDPYFSRRQVHQLYVNNKFEKIENTINYKFGNKAFLVQAFTHASYYKGRITGCYQRLEFLGDAVLDYMITRYLFEHPDRFAPGVLTDLRSALVNNTIFASLAVKYDFHKFFLAVSYPLAQKIESFAKSCHTQGSFDCPNFNDELFKVTEEEVEDGQEEEVEVPKALGDIFESLAGAIYLDCNRDLDVVWRVYYNLMKDLIEKCCCDPPQSPIRELFELKDAHARFSKLERIMETNKIRVTVEVGDNLRFHGMGRSFRIAKATAAKRALVYLRKLKSQKESRQ